MLIHSTDVHGWVRVAIATLTLVTPPLAATAHPIPEQAPPQPSSFAAPLSSPAPSFATPLSPPRVTEDGWVLQTPALTQTWPQPIPLDPQAPALPPLPSQIQGQPNGQAYRDPSQPTAPLPRIYPHHPSDPSPVLSPRPKRGKLHLDSAEIQVVTRTEEWTNGTQEKQHYRLTGSITNRSQHAVHKIKVHYRIRDGFLIRESGQFSIELSRLLQQSEYIDFNVPVTANGTLEIAFIDWKYADGTQGISQRGVF